MGEDRRMEGQAGKVGGRGGRVSGFRGLGSRVLGVQVSWYYNLMDRLLILLLCLADGT